MISIGCAWRVLLGAAVVVTYSGCDESRAVPPANTAMTVEEAQAMQVSLIDTLWGHPARHAPDWQDDRLDYYWSFGKTGWFRLVAADENATLSRRVLPAGFPEGEHRGYEGDWVIREDGLRLTNIRPATFWQPGTRPTRDEPVASEHAATVDIRWAGENQDGRHPELVIDGRRFGRSPSPVGAVALHSLEQLETYLSSSPFRAQERGSESGRVWTFNADGAFTAWIDPSTEDAPVAGPIVSQLAHDAVRITGRWRIAHEPPDDLDLVFSLNKNKSQLVLSDVRIEGGADDGRVIDELVVPLGWVDGKLRIEIDGVMYMRHAPR